MDTSDSRWLSYYFYMGRYGTLIDHLAVNELPALVEAVRPLKWFFIRYTDQEGPHVRFRVLVENDRVAEVQKAILLNGTFAVDRLATLPEPDYRPLVSFPSFDPMGGLDLENMMMPVEVRPVAYEPETDIYGEPSEGMPAAETFFNASSEIAIEVLRLEADGATGLRKTLAPIFMETVLNVFGAPQGRRQFYEFYGNYWITGSGLADTLSSNIDSKIEELREIEYPVVAAYDALDDQASALVDSWRDALAASLEEYKRAVPSFSEKQLEKLRFNFLHLMNNRLGVSPFDEAYLAFLIGRANYEEGKAA